MYGWFAYLSFVKGIDRGQGLMILLVIDKVTLEDSVYIMWHKNLRPFLNPHNNLSSYVLCKIVVPHLILRDATILRPFIKPHNNLFSEVMCKMVIPRYILYDTPILRSFINPHNICIWKLCVKWSYVIL